MAFILLSLSWCCFRQALVVHKKAVNSGDKLKRWLLWKSSAAGNNNNVRKGEERDKEVEEEDVIQCSEYTTPRASFVTPTPLFHAVLLAHRSALCIQTNFRGFLVNLKNILFQKDSLPLSLSLSHCSIKVGLHTLFFELFFFNFEVSCCCLVWIEILVFVC
jgi:hypothetical protein